MEFYGGSTSWWEEEEEEEGGSPTAIAEPEPYAPSTETFGLSQSFGDTSWWQDEQAQDFRLPYEGAEQEPDLSAYPIEQTQRFGFGEEEEVEEDPMLAEYERQQETGGTDERVPIYSSTGAITGYRETGGKPGLIGRWAGQTWENVKTAAGGIRSIAGLTANFVSGSQRERARLEEETLGWEQAKAAEDGDRERVAEIEQRLREMRTETPGRTASMLGEAWGETSREMTNMPEQGFVNALGESIESGDLVGVYNLLTKATLAEGPRMGAIMGAYATAGPGGAVLAGYVQETGGAYEEFQTIMEDDEKAWEASKLYGSVSSVLEMLPVARVFQKFGVKPTDISRGVLSWLFQGALEGGTENLQERAQILIGGEYADDAEAYMAQDRSGQIADATAIGTLLGLLTGMGDVGTGMMAAQEKVDRQMEKRQRWVGLLERSLARSEALLEGAPVSRFEGGPMEAALPEELAGKQDVITAGPLPTPFVNDAVSLVAGGMEEQEFDAKWAESFPTGEHFVEAKQQAIQEAQAEVEYATEKTGREAIRPEMEAQVAEAESAAERARLAAMSDEELRMEMGGQVFEQREPVAELPEMTETQPEPERRGGLFPVREEPKQLPEGWVEQEVGLPEDEGPDDEGPGGGTAIPLGPSPVAEEIQEEAEREDRERVYEGEFEEVTRALPAAGPERFTEGAAVTTPKGNGIIQKVFKNGKIRVKGIGVFSPDEIELMQATPLGPAPEKPVQEPPQEAQEPIAPEEVPEVQEEEIAPPAAQEQGESAEGIGLTGDARYWYEAMRDGVYLPEEGAGVLLSELQARRQAAEKKLETAQKNNDDVKAALHKGSIEKIDRIIEWVGKRTEKKAPAPAEQAEEEGPPDLQYPAHPAVFEAPKEAEPAVPSREPVDIPEELLGPTVEKTTPENTEFEAQWAVLDAAEPIVSHDLEGNENPEFPQEKQQRDRGSKASQEWLRKTSEKMDPEQLLDSRVANTGAPVVDPSLVTESGNQRMRLIRTVYAAKKGTKQYAGAVKYRARVRKKAKELGIKIPKSIKNPVLVFVRRSGGDAVKLTREMNVPTVAEMGTGERAATDAERITTKALAQINPTATGDINMGNSGEFIREFVRQLPENERAGMMDRKGNLSPAGLARIRNAVLVKAFGKSETVVSLLEDEESNIKKIGKALVVAAPHIARLQEAIEAGDAAAVDPAPEINQAIQAIAAMRKEGVNVEDRVRQASLLAEQEDPMVNLLIGAFGGSPTVIEKYGLGEKGIHDSVKKMSQVLIRYAEIAREMAGAKQDALFEGLPETSKFDVLESALKDFDTAGQQTIEGMGGQPGEFRGTATAKAQPKSKPGKKGVKTKPPKGQVKSIALDSLQFAEAIQFVRQLMKGKYPRVMKHLRGALGRVRYRPGKEIKAVELAAGTAKEEAVGLVLWHEIAHVIDLIPQKFLKGRGNIFGHIAAVMNYSKHTLAKHVEDFPNYLTSKERAEIRKTAKKNKLDPKEEIEKELERRGLVSKQQIMEELIGLSEAWRGPIPKEKGKDRDYRMSPAELYADGAAVILNDPEYAQKHAPMFTGMFHSYMVQRPDVLKHWIGFVEKTNQFEEDRISDLKGEYRRSLTAARAKRARQMLERYKGKVVSGVQAIREISDAFIERRGDVYRRVKKAEQKNLKWWEKVTPFGRKGTRLDPDINPVFWLEEGTYVSGLQRAYASDVQQEVLEPLEHAGIDSIRLGELLGLRRAATERAEIFNPLGIGGELAQKFYEANKNELTEAQWAVMRGAMQALWKIRQEYVVKTVEKYGSESAAMTKKIVENPFYARYTAQELIDAELESGKMAGPTSALQHQIGMLGEIGDPLLETILTDIALVRWLHHNQATRYAIEFLAKTDPDSIEVAKRGKNGVIVETTDPEKTTVRYKIKGKTKAYYVPKAFGEAIGQPNAATMLHLFYNKWIVMPQRWAFVQYNPGFAYYNIFRDALRAYANVYKGAFKGDPVTPLFKMAYWYMKAAPETWKYVFGKHHGVTTTTKKMAREKSLIGERKATEAMAGDVEQDGLTILFEHFNIHGAALAQKPGIRGALTRIGKGMATILGGPSEYTERWTKIAGHRYLEESGDYPDLTPQERARIIRSEIGTPDPYRRGKWHSATNSLWLFSNISKEGLRADYAAMKRDPVGWWMKQAFTVGAIGYGSMYLSAFIAAGADEEKFKRMLDKIPEHYKGKYFIVVWGENQENGKVRFSGIPLPWTAQIMGSLFHMGLNRSEYSYQDYLKELLDFTPWGWVSVNPGIQAISGAIQYMTGGNPMDHYTNRPAIPRSVHDAQGTERHKAFWKWFWYKAGGGTFTRYEFTENEDLSWWQKWTPLGPMQRRFLKETDYGVEQEGIGRRSEEGMLDARKKNLRRKTIENVLELHPRATAEYVQGQLRKTKTKDFPDGIAFTRIGDLRRALKDLRMRTSPDVFERMKGYERTEEGRKEVEEFQRQKEKEWRGED